MGKVKTMKIKYKGKKGFPHLFILSLSLSLGVVFSPITKHRRTFNVGDEKERKCKEKKIPSLHRHNHQSTCFMPSCVWSEEKEENIFKARRKQTKIIAIKTASSNMNQGSWFGLLSL